MLLRIQTSENNRCGEVATLTSPRRFTPWTSTAPQWLMVYFVPFPDQQIQDVHSFYIQIEGDTIVTAQVAIRHNNRSGDEWAVAQG